MGLDRPNSNKEQLCGSLWPFIGAQKLFPLFGPGKTLTLRFLGGQGGNTHRLRVVLFFLNGPILTLPLVMNGDDIIYDPV